MSRGGGAHGQESGPIEDLNGTRKGFFYSAQQKIRKWGPCKQSPLREVEKGELLCTQAEALQKNYPTNGDSPAEIWGSKKFEQVLCPNLWFGGRSSPMEGMGWLKLRRGRDNTLPTRQTFPLLCLPGYCGKPPSPTRRKTGPWRRPWKKQKNEEEERDIKGMGQGWGGD